MAVPEQERVEGHRLVHSELKLRPKVIRLHTKKTLRRKASTIQCKICSVVARDGEGQIRLS